MVYPKDTELRKIGTAEFLYIVKLLNDSPTSETGSWAVLMRNIKSPDGQYRFTAKDESLVEGDVASRKKSAAEIFLEEWSTMGKKRPTLEDLMNLLVEVKLIKVANYVAALLGCDPPKRPDCRAPFDVSEMLENQIENQDNVIDNSQISPSITDAAPSTAACHSYDGCKDTKLKSFDNTVQPPQSSSSSLSTSSSGVNEPLQNDTRESSDSSLSLKATNAETTYIPKIENVISSEIPSFLNNNNPTTFESITSDESISINSNSSNSNSDIGLPVFLPHYNNETKK